MIHRLVSCHPGQCHLELLGLWSSPEPLVVGFWAITQQRKVLTISLLFTSIHPSILESAMAEAILSPAGAVGPTAPGSGCGWTAGFREAYEDPDSLNCEGWRHVTSEPPGAG